MESGKACLDIVLSYHSIIGHLHYPIDQPRVASSLLSVLVAEEMFISWKLLSLHCELVCLNVC